MNRHYKISGFLVSIALHGVLVAVLIWQQAFDLNERPAVRVLPLKLEMFEIMSQAEAEVLPEKIEEPIKKMSKPEKKLVAVKEKQIIKKKAVVKRHKPREVVTTPEEVKSSAVVQAPVSPVVANALTSPVSNHGEQNLIRESYQQELLKVIATHKYYPRRARRRHLEGRVEVSFVVQANGEISNLHLAASSGEKVLDKAALEVLHKVGRFAPLPKGLDLNSWAFIVPIEYRLL